MEKTTTLFLKTSFYRSYGFLMIGILMFIFSINNLNKTIDDFPWVKGKIIESHLRWNKAPYSIKLNSNKKSWFRIYDKNLYPILKEKATKGKRATIWYNDDHLIEQLQVEGEIIYPYSKATWLWVIVMLFGIGLSVGNIVYLIRYPSHAEGKDDKINE